MGSASHEPGRRCARRGEDGLLGLEAPAGVPAKLAGALAHHLLDASGAPGGGGGKAPRRPVDTRPMAIRVQVSQPRLRGGVGRCGGKAGRQVWPAKSKVFLPGVDAARASLATEGHWARPARRLPRGLGDGHFFLGGSPPGHRLLAGTLSTASSSRRAANTRPAGGVWSVLPGARCAGRSPRRACARFPG